MFVGNKYDKSLVKSFSSLSTYRMEFFLANIVWKELKLRRKILGNCSKTH